MTRTGHHRARPAPDLATGMADARAQAWNVTHDAIIITDPHGLILDWNPAAEMLFGYSSAEAIGQSTTMLHLPEDAARIAAIREAVTQAGQWRGELVVERRDGTLRYTATTLQPWRDTQGAIAGIIGCHHDITAYNVAAADREHTLAQERATLLELEREAEAQRQLVDTMIASTPFGVALFDATDEFRCQRHNPPFLQLVGPLFREQGTIVGVPLADLFDAESAARVRAVYEIVRTSGASVFLNEFPAVLALETEPRWYRWSLTPLVDATGAVTSLINSAIEITELVQAREAQRREALELEAVFGALAAAVVVFDQHGYLTRLNPAARQLYDEVGGEQYHRQPMAKRSRALDLYDDRGQRLPPDRWPGARVLRGETFAGEDVRYAAANGAIRELNMAGMPLRDAQGAIVGGVTVYQDVAARRMLERHTHVSLDALLRMAQTAVATGGDINAVARQLADVTREVMSCTRVGVMIVDVETQIVRSLAVVGLSETEERQWWAMQPEGAKYGAGGDPDQAARFAAGEVMVLDMTAPPLDAVPNPFGITTALYVPIRYDDRLVGFFALDHSGVRHHFTADEIALAKGVADLAALVMERERLLAQRASTEATVLSLQEAGKRVDEFLGIVSHELRTPLTSLKMQTDLVLRRLEALVGELDAQHPATMRIMPLLGLLRRNTASMARLNHLVDDLLDNSRIQSGTLRFEKERGDLIHVTREAVDDQIAASPDRQITFTAPATPIAVEADLERIGQVVTNFLTNALKYSNEDRPVAVRVRRDGRMARVEVQDEGPGLPEGAHEQVWERFHRVAGIEVLSGSGVGLGLGLYICKTIIDQHGGQIGVQSQPGHGATFWFTLPLAGRATRPAARDED